MSKITALLLMLAAPSLALAADEPSTPGRRAGHSVGIGLASGWTVGALGGVGLYAGYQALTAPPCDDDLCGMGNALRPIVLGIPTGVGIGTALGATGGHHLAGGDRAGIVLAAAGIPAVLGAAALMAAPAVESEALAYGGLATSLLVVPVVAGVTSASLEPRGSGRGRRISVQPMLGATRGLRVSGTF